MTCPHGSPSVIHDAIGIDQEKAIVALINEATVKQAATVVGVSETTLYRWMREATFAKAYREARRERELGRVVVFDQFKNDFPSPKREQDATPTPCPRCGKDLNTHVIIHRVGMIAQRRAEGGWLDAGGTRYRDRLNG